MRIASLILPTVCLHWSGCRHACGRAPGCCLDARGPNKVRRAWRSQGSAASRGKPREDRLVDRHLEDLSAPLQVPGHLLMLDTAYN
jgi:hypothetical protein